MFRILSRYLNHYLYVFLNELRNIRVFYNLLKFVCFGYFRSDIVYDAYQLFLWVFYIAGFFLLGIFVRFFFTTSECF